MKLPVSNPEVGKVALKADQGICTALSIAKTQPVAGNEAAHRLAVIGLMVSQRSSK